MEVEPASRTEFEEDNLKQKEGDAKDITEINGNNDENDIEIDVKLSDTIKDKAKFNDNDPPPSLSPHENAKQEALDNDPSEKLISQINGSIEEKQDQENDANNSDVKPKDESHESLKMEEEEEDEVKEEPMDQDLDPDPEPELPAFEDQDRSVKLEDPLFDEKLIDGFSFRAFDKYTVLEECCKWSAQNPGKTPDPWYKLKFRPKPVKPKPVKEKKEKKEKELTKKQKEKLEKVSSNSSSERGPNCDTDKSDSDKAADRVSDPHFAKKSLNGHSPGRSRPNGAVSGGSQPLNFSLGSDPGRYPGPAPGHAQARSGGLYRPYEVSPSAAPRPGPQGPPGSSHQNPAPRQIYSAPSTVPGHYPQAPAPASHYNYHSGSQQVHPAYRPPGNTTAGPSPAHYKGYHHHQQHQQHHHHSGQQQHQHHQQQQQHYYNRGYPGQYPSSGYPPAQSNGVAPPHPGHPGHPGHTGHAPSSHSTSQASYRQPQHSQQPSRDSYSSSYHNSTGDPSSKHNSWSSSGYPAPGPPASSAAPPSSSAGVTAATLAPHSRPPHSQPQPAPASLHRPTTDPRYPGSSSERGPAPGASVYPPTAGGQPPGQPQSQPPGQPLGQTQQQPQNSTILPPTPMMKDVPKLGGPDSLFYRAGLEAGSGFPPRLGLTSGPVTPGQFPASAAAPGQPQAASQATKKTGKWNAMHVRIAWEIYNHQKNKTDPKTIGGLPGSGLQPSGKIGPSSLDLLNKPGVLAGAGGQPSFPKRPGPELTRPHQAPASLLPPVTGHLRLPTPPSHFDPRDPYAAQRAYYGTSHLGSSTMAAAAAASYPRYPSVAAPPFGGLGGIVPSPMVSGAHPAAARPMSHPSLAATSTPSYPSYPGAHGALAHPGAASREKEDRDRAEAERRARERREAEERQRHREAEQSHRDAEARSSREGFPSYVRDRNGDSGEGARERERSPVRPGSGLAKDRRGSGAGGEAVTAVVDLSTSQKTPTDMSVTPRPVSDLSSTVTSRPGSVVSHHGTPPALPVKLVTSGELRQREERICDDISIIAEKPGEGNRSGANSVTGRASVSSDHSITRINGGPASGHENGLKSDSPAGLKPPGHHSLGAGAAHPAASPYGGLYPGPQARPGQPPPPSAASSYLAAAAAAGQFTQPSPDPRTLAMFPHMMSQSLRPPNPLDPYSASYAALDPYRDPFRLDLLGRDPLREARDRELLRLGAGAGAASLGSLELERAKAYGLGAAGAGYPGLAPPSAYPGYPPTTYAAAHAAQAAASASLAHSHAHKMASAHGLGSLYPSSAGLHPGLAGYPGAALGYPGPAAGLNGAAGQFNGKDPLRR